MFEHMLGGGVSCGGGEKAMVLTRRQFLKAGTFGLASHPERDPQTAKLHNSVFVVAANCTRDKRSEGWKSRQDLSWIAYVIIALMNATSPKPPKPEDVVASCIG
jgi:hypothetical protein